MEELIEKESASYERYEQLLIRRDVLKKEAYQHQLHYQREFGQLLVEVFEAKISCIEKKKIIAFCQKRLNRGLKVSQQEIDNYIEAVMVEYREQLNFMLETNKQLETSRLVSDLDFRKIKAAYYRLARQIHPDMVPALKGDKTIADLWNRVVAAYQGNDLKELEDLELLVNRYLESINYAHKEVVIPNIDERIFELNQEIEEIISTDPYQYKFLLMDKEAVSERKKDLEDELTDYRKYAGQLDEVIASFNIERIVS